MTPVKRTKEEIEQMKTEKLQDKKDEKAFKHMIQMAKKKGALVEGSVRIDGKTVEM